MAHRWDASAVAAANAKIAATTPVTAESRILIIDALAFLQVVRELMAR
jgi:hypothetical protein